ncbi:MULTISPECIES: helix-turn-helix domain-containing protein [unclassified Tenacibaculum]|uniref:helix-turn-helix domain-containing protein n=1 Tax=unclassified Tenacibaculum TaxID=2635139 RepID=UPI001F22E67B|nr:MULTISPECIES: helix-turn-helix domain-containing protein [unclassified Tenacibaculum]MCF2875813.1 helix-turn-helix domain-containing protein [Tenacibaculum sp. Cn5-1]MCF2935888.1 helix-turn-helix domain-containing protein [Tenacibaculum sp. Cn5-34]MCG7512449.1 helix-turn-helix domain-containing protein [Tenacibaculum sp. Cn5-46]
MRFKEINDLFEKTGFPKRTNLPGFFILKFSEIPENTLTKMLPYQKDYYQISLIKQADKAKIKIHLETSKTPENMLFFLSPEHVYSWVRGSKTEGYIIYFKASFLNLYRGDFKQTFQYFDLTQANSLILEEKEIQDLEIDFEKMYAEYYSKTLYRKQILQSFLLSFLFKIKGIKENKEIDIKELSQKEQLFQKFTNLINNCFLQEKNVVFYADQLNVSANYLNQIIKKQTGKTAKSFIQQKVLSEAQKMLVYTTLDISEIAYQLGFDEPTHFSRFFKSKTKITPKSYRDGVL